MLPLDVLAFPRGQGVGVATEEIDDTEDMKGLLALRDNEDTREVAG